MRAGDQKLDHNYYLHAKVLEKYSVHNEQSTSYHMHHFTLIPVP